MYYSFLKKNYIKKQKNIKKDLISNKIMFSNIYLFIYLLYNCNNLKKDKTQKNFKLIFGSININLK